MHDSGHRIERRAFVTGTLTLAAMTAGRGVARAQGGAIRLGTLTPLTGAGGSYGPSMRRAIEWVVSEVNAAGGVLGRKVELASEDDQTNPEAAVRAARKLIDVDKVAAVMGTWASAVTTAVAPALLGVQDLPHHGVGLRHHYPAAASGVSRPHPAQHASADRQAGRLHPHAQVQARVRARRADTVRAAFPEAPRRDAPKGGSELVGGVIYDKDKTTFRSEIDQAPEDEAGHGLPQRLHPGRHRGHEGALQGRLRRRQDRARATRSTRSSWTRCPPR